MAKKKKVLSNDSLRVQLEKYIFEGVAEFEDMSGFQVSHIDITHKTGIGFEAKNIMEINIRVD